jgi:hypothetical protein
MLERAQTRALPLLNRAPELVPSAQACCGACRTCVTTNVFTALAAGAVFVSGPLVRLGPRLARRRESLATAGPPS